MDVHPNELGRLPLLICRRSPEYPIQFHCRTSFTVTSENNVRCAVCNSTDAVYSVLVSQQGEHQRRLYRDLMKDYNPLERPVFNDTHSLTVYFSFSLMQIMDVVNW